MIQIVSGRQAGPITRRMAGHRKPKPPPKPKRPLIAAITGLLLNLI
jgi:hypothetical protein